MTKIRINGYSDKISAKAGETVQFMVSAENTAVVHAELVKLIHGDQHPSGPGFIEQAVESSVNRSWPVKKQYIQKGNFLRVADPEHRLATTGPVTLHAFIFPTLPAAGRQAIMGAWSADRGAGYALGLNESGALEFWVGDGNKTERVAAGRPIHPKLWYFVAASFDSRSSEATLYQKPVLNRYNSLLSPMVPFDFGVDKRATFAVRPNFAGQPAFLIGGANDSIAPRGAVVSQCYNGKIDRCGVQGRVLDRPALDAIAAGGEPPADGLIARWDTTAGYTPRGIGDRVVDRGPFHLDAVGVNCPVRGQTGWNWGGRNDSYRMAPEEYGGIEFHNDALTECGWEPTLSFVVPETLKSGVYAVKLTAGAAAQRREEYIPFVVRAARPRAPICFLLPTASYLAYANVLNAVEADVSQAITSTVGILQDEDIDAYKNDIEFGLSSYDLHNDGAGVCHSSYHRPIIDMRPKYRMPGLNCPWQFPADLSVVAWLEHLGYDYEVITDEDLHRDGVAALKPYKTVINGTHAEYYSERMMDATEDYLADGGRLMYLSGNGYYWVVGFRDEAPWVMEVRRLEAGTRAWQARPGEHYMTTTGERGGLWRHRNRAPQKLVGTGFTSQGMDESRPYRRLPDSHDKTVSWIFEGMKGEQFGGFGLAGGGAAGIEIDRYDLALGTPPHALVLATSEPFSDNYPLVHEEMYGNFSGTGGTQHPFVRCDMVYFTTRNGGAVFSPSSIAWGSALPWANFNNDVSRIMKNVLDAFIKDGPLPGTKA